MARKSSKPDVTDPTSVAPETPETVVSKPKRKAASPKAAKPKTVKAAAGSKAKATPKQARVASSASVQGTEPGDRRKPEKGQVDQQVPGQRVRRQGKHGARPRPPQAEARAGRAPRLRAVV